MRLKDENKKTAICNAAIELITTEGFANTSISKIAKQANVSAATIYIYFENKEDLLNKLYLCIKQEASSAFLKGFHEDMPIHEGIKLLWFNIYHTIIAEPVKFAFGEQFANSPLVNRVSKTEGSKYFKPIYNLLKRGIDQGVIKNVSPEILMALILAPIMFLAKQQLSGEILINEAILQDTFGLTWDAITV